ncbi:MAG TPA: 5-oxoprolinase subunit PxpB [Magnetospirillaceae bacterium]|nr:5-oxoprolinase subunit PxpB [Magnetospirillaceae bacterium]
MIGFPSIHPYGETALIVLCGEGITEDAYRKVRGIQDALTTDPPEGLLELIPAYNSLLVVYDFLSADFAAFAKAVRSRAERASSAPEPPGRVVEIPVCYEGPHAPDLEEVARHAGLPPREVIEIHSSATYLVYMLGFTPGFPYLGGMDGRIASPRRASPRIRVPEGSVGIADRQTGIYPQESPGGWNLVGRTPAVLFDPLRESPALLAAGQRVRFRPIPASLFEKLYAAAGRRSFSAAAKDRDSVSGRSPSVPEASAASIVVRSPGALTTVQDLGRTGYQPLGVPPAGAADRDAMETANLLVGNERGEACLECTLLGPELEFTGPAAFAVCGAAMQARLNGVEVPAWETLYAEAGDILSLGTAEAGLRAYLAFAGGLSVPVVLGSRSTCLLAGFGGWQGRALCKADRLPLAAGPTAAAIPARFVPYACRPGYPSEICARAIPFHEVDRFEAESVERFFREPYEVSPKSDRMGCRLSGIPLVHANGADIVSSGVQTGTVQVPGDGMPIVLLPDRQTTGGYTRIAQVIKADLPMLGQVRPGDKVRFIKATVDEARKAWRGREIRIAQSIRTRPEGRKWFPAPPLAVPQEAALSRSRLFRVTVNGRKYDVEVEET